MAAEEEKGSKPFDPTPRRLEKAREEGDAVRSDDLQTGLALTGLLTAAALAGRPMTELIAGQGLLFLGQPDQLPLRHQPDLAGRGILMALPAFGLLLPAAILVLFWLIASRGLVFAPSKLRFRSDRLSVIANFKQKFGRAGLVDFLKKTAKMLLISAVLTWFLRSRASLLLHSLHLSPGQILLLVADMLFAFLLLVVAVQLSFGLADLFWQKLQFLRRHRMSHKEMRDELKDSEGDPFQKADRLRRAREIASRKMLRDMPKADVVIVNPSHYAVALRWERAKGRAPVCIAKGQDEMAARIRALALEHHIPIHRDPPTARALYAALEPGDEIRPEHYAAVAAAIRFAAGLRKRARAGWSARNPPRPRGRDQ